VIQTDRRTEVSRGHSRCGEMLAGEGPNGGQTSRSIVGQRYGVRKAAIAVLLEGRNLCLCEGCRKSSRACPGMLAEAPHA